MKTFKYSGTRYKKDDPLKFVKFKRGGELDILRTYAKLHEGKLGAQYATEDKNV